MKKKLFKYIFTINLFLLALQVLLTSWRAVEGDSLSQVQNQTVQVKMMNQRLENQVYKLTSIQAVHDYVATSGMLPAQITRLSPLPVAAASHLP